jgi:divalent metal cation (Fe/Co/Zn/Cd) transporter
MRTQHIGPEEILVAAKVQFRSDLTVSQMVDAIDSAESRVREAVAMVDMIYLEPDLYDHNHPSR